MFLRLDIKNYALIRHLSLTLSTQLNLITGETGTGKSIVLGAIGLLLGNRADSKVLQNESKKCVVEGTFNIKNYGLDDFFEQDGLDYDDNTLLRREVIHGGKSRAFINDTPVTVDTLKKLGQKLMNIHSQHEVVILKNQLSQLNIIDLYASNAILKKEYQQAWKKATTAKRHYNSILEEANVLREESEYVNYQLEELLAAGLEKDEQEHLENELKIMEHSEEIKHGLATVLHGISGESASIETIFGEVKTQLSTLSRYAEKYAQLRDRFENLWIELQDIAAAIEQEDSEIEYDPKKVTMVKERIDLIYTLMHKHKRNTIAELLLLQKELQAKASKYNDMDHELNTAKQALQAANTALESKAEKLSDTRVSVMDDFCTEIMALLQQLSIPHAKLKVMHTKPPPDTTGADRIELLFSANKGVVEKPLAQVASGGEFSRLMFCIQYILAKKTSLPTLILDEIDTGISGEIAIRMGNMMKKMSGQCQLIVISHLPQIAAKADRHFYAYKESADGKTTSNIKLLNDDERVMAIAKMISGDKPPASATESARALMKG